MGNYGYSTEAVDSSGMMPTPTPLPPHFFAFVYKSGTERERRECHVLGSVFLISRQFSYFHFSHQFQKSLVSTASDIVDVFIRILNISLLIVLTAPSTTTIGIC